MKIYKISWKRLDFSSLKTRIGLDFIKMAFSMIPNQEQKLLLKLIPVAILLSLIEVLGVISLAASGSMIVRNISQGGRPTRVELFFEQTLNMDLSVSFLTLFLITFSMSLLIARIVIGAYFSYRLLSLYSNLETKLSVDALRILISETFENISSRTSGDALNAVLIGSSRIVIGVIQPLLNLITDIASVILIGVLFFIATPQTAISVLLVLAVGRRIIRNSISSHSKRISKDLYKLQTGLNESVITSIEASREIRTYNLGTKILENFANTRSEFASRFLRNGFLNSLYRYFLEVFILLAACLIFAIEVTAADLRRAVSSLVLFLVGAFRLIPALQRIQSSFLSINLAKGMSSGFVELIMKNKALLTDASISTSKSEKTILRAAPELTISGLTFAPLSHPSKSILRNITFNLPANKVLCVVGPSGSGKSTLLDLLSGLLHPSSGNIFLNDSYDSFSGAHMVQVSYCTQFPYIDSKSLIENVLLFGNDFFSESNIILEQLDIKRFLNTQSWLAHHQNLSGGEKQRIGLARAFINNTHFLLLDEPTSALDIESRLRVHKLIEKSKNSATIVVVTHDLEIIKVSDYILKLENGNQVYFGPATEYIQLGLKY